VRVSISITDVSGTGPAGLAGHLADTARAADEAGLDTVWVADHLLQAVPGTAVDDPVLEAYTTLGFLAAHTRRVRLGTLVTAVTFRPPPLLIKAVTTLDVLSGGRTWLGVGAGHHLEEAEAMGLPLPPTPERFAHLEDTLRATCSTSPTAGPPCAASWTSSPGCAAIDRPVDEITTTVSTRLHPDEPAVGLVDRCAALADLGIDHAVVLTARPWTAARMDTLARAASDLADVTPRSRTS